MSRTEKSCESFVIQGIFGAQNGGGITRVECRGVEPMINVAEVTALGVNLDSRPHDHANLPGPRIGGGVLDFNPLGLVAHGYSVIPYLLVSLWVNAFPLPI